MLLLFCKPHKAAWGTFAYPQHTFAFSPNPSPLSQALSCGNPSLAEIIPQKYQIRPHIIYPAWPPVLCYNTGRNLHYKATWMFFKIFKIKSDYWLERFRYCSFTEKYCNTFIAFSTAEEDPVPSALPGVWLFRFYEAFHYVNYGGLVWPCCNLNWSVMGQHLQKMLSIWSLYEFLKRVIK